MNGVCKKPNFWWGCLYIFAALLLGTLMAFTVTTFANAAPEASPDCHGSISTSETNCTTIVISVTPVPDYNVDKVTIIIDGVSHITRNWQEPWNGRSHIHYQVTIRWKDGFTWPSGYFTLYRPECPFHDVYFSKCNDRNGNGVCEPNLAEEFLKWPATLRIGDGPSVGVETSETGPVLAGSVQEGVVFTGTEGVQPFWVATGETQVVMVMPNEDVHVQFTNQYVPPNLFPVCSLEAHPLSGNAPLTVFLDATLSYDPDGTIVDFSWKFGDLKTLSGTNAKPSHVYPNSGQYPIEVTITDNDGGSSTCPAVIIIVEEPVEPKCVSNTWRFIGPTHFDVGGQAIGENVESWKIVNSSGARLLEGLGSTADYAFSVQPGETYRVVFMNATGMESSGCSIVPWYGFMSVGEKDYDSCVEVPPLQIDVCGRAMSWPFEKPENVVTRQLVCNDRGVLPEGMNVTVNGPLNEATVQWGTGGYKFLGLAFQWIFYGRWDYGNTPVVPTLMPDGRWRLKAPTMYLITHARNGCYVSYWENSDPNPEEAAKVMNLPVRIFSPFGRWITSP